MPINKTKVKKILVITLSNIGDIILTTPVIEALIAEFPAAQLDVMTGPSGEELFNNYGGVSEVIVYDKRSSWLGKFLLFAGLFKKRYSLVADLRNTVLPVVLLPPFGTNPFRRPVSSSPHKKDAHLARLKEIGIDISKGRFAVETGEADRKYAESLLAPLGGRPFVAMSPGAKSHVKRWPLKNFASLCDMLKEKLGINTVLIGDKYDRVVAERVLFYAKAKPLSLVEKTGIYQLAHVIKRAELLVTNDSAPLHLGSAVDAKILAFFGPTDDKKYGPVTKNKKRVLRKNIKCSPCEAPQCVNYDNKYECLRSITVEEAFEAVKELLKT